LINGTLINGTLLDGTLLADLQAAVQAAWMAGSHATVAELLRQYALFDWMCPCCAGLRATRFTSANAAHRDALLIRLCESCKMARQQR
jgi:hypothetical protein